MYARPFQTSGLYEVQFLVLIVSHLTDCIQKRQAIPVIIKNIGLDHRFGHPFKP